MRRTDVRSKACSSTFWYLRSCTVAQGYRRTVPMRVPQYAALKRPSEHGGAGSWHIGRGNWSGPSPAPGLR